MYLNSTSLSQLALRCIQSCQWNLSSGVKSMTTLGLTFVASVSVLKEVDLVLGKLQQANTYARLDLATEIKDLKPNLFRWEIKLQKQEWFLLLTLSDNDTNIESNSFTNSVNVGLCVGDSCQHFNIISYLREYKTRALNTVNILSF